MNGCRYILILLGLTILGGCSFQSGKNDSNWEEFLLSLINSSRSSIPRSLIPEDSPNSPIGVTVPDEVLATNPTPPPFPTIIPRLPNGPILEELGARLRIDIDSANYSSSLIYSFHSKHVGTSEYKPARITNEGDRALTIFNLEVVSAQNQFGLSGIGQSLVLEPSESIDFYIRFNPAGVGQRMGELRIVSNDIRMNLGHQEFMGNYTLSLRGHGTEQPIAVVTKPSTHVSLFQRIVIEFSHSMNRDSVCKTTSGESGLFGSLTHSIGSGGDQIRLINISSNSVVEGRCRWRGHRQLILEPFKALSPLSEHRVELVDSYLDSASHDSNPTAQLHCIGLPASCNMTRTVTFRTEPAFNIPILVNNHDVTGVNARGMISTRAIESNPITYRLSVAERDIVDSILLKKLGQSNVHMNISPNSPSVMTFPPIQGEITVLIPFSLIPTALRLTPGSNAYYLEIHSGGKVYTRSFAVNWGQAQGNPTTSPVLAGARVVIGRGNLGIEQLGGILEKLVQSNGDMTPGSGNFQLNGNNFSAPIIYRTGNTSNGSNTITGINTSGIQVGMAVRGRSIIPMNWVTAVGTSTVTLASAATDAHGPPGGSVRLTFGPDFIKNGVVITSGSDQIQFSDSNGMLDGQGRLRYNYFLSSLGNHYPNGTFLLERISGNTYRTSRSALSSGTSVVSLDQGYLQNNRRVSLPIKQGDCLGGDAQSSNYIQMSWISTFGPFCRIYWEWGNHLANGYADVYLTNVTIENSAPGDPRNRNVLVRLNPEKEKVMVELSAKRLRGTLRLHTHHENLLAQLGGIENSIYEVDFIMNFDGTGCDSTVGIHNYSSSKGFNTAKSMVTLNIPGSNGAINFSIQGGPPWNSPSNNDLHISEWNNQVCAHNIVPIRGAWTGNIVISILGQVIPGIQWQIVQGLVRDTIQIIAPTIFNALFSQLRIEPGDSTPNGIGVNLPDYLPTPLNQSKLFIGANIRQSMMNRTHDDGLDLGVDFGILACLNPSILSKNCLPSQTPIPGSLLRPEPHSGTGLVDSFLLNAGNSDSDLPPSHMRRTLLDTNGTGLIMNHPGVLIGAKIDVINQALYNLWKKGILELRLDQNFANQVRAYRGSENRLFQIFQILLKADSLLRVIAPGQPEIFFGQGVDDKIHRNDDISFRLIPYLPPHVKPSHLSHSQVVPSSGGRKFPLMDIEWSDLRIQIWGKKSNGFEYLISTLQLNLRTRAAINIHRFNSPINNGLNNYRNVTSIQLNICDDNTQFPSVFDCDLLRTTNGINDDLEYTLTILDDPIHNPLGLDPGAIHEVLNPSIQKLILPVVNFILEELPLEEKSITLPEATSANQPGTREDPNHPSNKIMANCGIRLENMKILPIPEDSPFPYILIHTELKDYVFSGNCKL